MPIYEIRDDEVIAHATAPSSAKDALLLRSRQEFEKLDLPMVRLVAIWNALPGGTPIAKFEDRKTAVRRLWAAFETLKPATRASKTNRSKDGRKPSKQADLISLLRRPEGATLEELVATTGWQPHSVRGALSGTIRKKLGLDLSSEKSDRGRVYRIVAKAA